MKQEANEPNGNYLSHRILSWCGEHKMKLILTILVFGSLLGGYWYTTDRLEGQCGYISLSLSWDSIDVYEIKGEPVVSCHEDEEMKLIVKASATKSGVLEITASPEKNKPIWLTTTKESADSPKYVYRV